MSRMAEWESCGSFELSPRPAAKPIVARNSARAKATALPTSRISIQTRCLSILLRAVNLAKADIASCNYLQLVCQRRKNARKLLIWKSQF